MQERFEETPVDQVLTDDEVKLVIERYGEMEAAKRGPKVRDVAEAMGVEPSVVSKILSEIRESKSDDDLKERLETLEEENARLRDRVHNEPIPALQPLPARRGGFGPFAIIGFIFLAMMLARASGLGAGSGAISISTVFIGAIIVVFFLRWIRSR